MVDSTESTLRTSTKVNILFTPSYEGNSKDYYFLQDTIRFLNDNKLVCRIKRYEGGMDQIETLDVVARKFSHDLLLITPRQPLETIGLYFCSNNNASIHSVTLEEKGIKLSIQPSSPNEIQGLINIDYLIKYS